MATKPPLQLLSANNHGPAVVVSSLVFVIVALSTVVTRLLTRVKVAHQFVVDDLLISIAMVLSIAQTSALIIACNNGLGHHIDDIDPSNFEIYSKAIYAAEILFVATLAFTKVSVAWLIKGLHPPPTTIYACYTIILVVGGWSLSSILATIFQCSLPTPWTKDGGCINLSALDVYNTTMNVLTDLALVVVPSLLMHQVQVANKKRWLVIGFFASRLIAVAFSIVAIVTRRRTLATSDDVTWHLVESTIWMQGMLAVSIMTACLPSIRRFLGDLRTGMIHVHISEPLERTMRHSISATGGPGSNQSCSFATKQTSNSSKRSDIRASVTVVDEENDQNEPDRRLYASKRYSRGKPSHYRSESTQAPAQNVILHSIDYEVKYQEDKSDEIGPADSAPAATNPSDLAFRASSDHRMTIQPWS